MRRIKQAAGKTFDSGFSTPPGMFDRTVIFQLRLLLGYAALVHSGFFLLGLIFFRSPFMIYHVAIVLGFFLFSKYIHSGNFILIYCLTFVEIGVHSYILYWFLGSNCAIELYYLLLVPVASYSLLLPYSKRFQTCFIILAFVCNVAAYTVFLLISQFYKRPLMVTKPVLTLFLVFSVVTVFGMSGLETYFFLSHIIGDFRIVEGQKEDLSLKASYDALTKIYNRWEISRRLDIAFEKSRKEDTPLSVCIGDLDNFKRINDTFGHNAGDFILKSVAQILNANVRRTDPLGRWGGEEFLLVMEAEADVCYRRAEILRKLIEEHLFVFDEKTIPVTITFGVASAGETTDTSTALVGLADKMLYKGKKEGRNRTEHQS